MCYFDIGKIIANPDILPTLTESPYIPGKKLITTMLSASFRLSVRGRERFMDNIVWHTGWPKKSGWYKCRVDGELECLLKYYVCQVSMKPHWVDSNGDYMESMGHIEWSEATQHER